MDVRPTFPPHQPRGEQPRSLAGVRVVDLSRVLAGPFATQMLGDLGADILKIENPRAGDDTRWLIAQPNLGGENFFYLALNRNKRSVAVDINTDEGREIIFRLLADADVLVENYTTRVMQRAGLDYDALKERFPRLIFCSISAYGRTGRLAHAGGFDSAISVEAGVASLNALPDERPVVGGVPFIDITTAMNATIGILAALRARDMPDSETFGKGQFIDIAMYDTAIADLSYKGYQYLASGQNPVSLGRKPKFGMPGGEFECADGVVWFTCTTQKMFHALCDHVIDRPELKDDPRFLTIKERNQNVDEMIAALEAEFIHHDRAYWGDRLKRAGVPCGEVRLVGEALISRETEEREMVREIAHPTAGSVPVIASPVKMSLTPPVDPVAPPLLGQHTAEVLHEAGYSSADIARMEQLKVIALHERPAKDAA